MVIKMHKAAEVHASLNYVISKMGIEDNRILMYKNVSPEGEFDKDILEAVRSEFQTLDRANIRTDKISFHVSINPTELELQEIDIMEVCKEYMKRMGYANQPYVVVEHNDTGRKHYHIISHRVQSDGKKINDSNEIRRTNGYVREICGKMRQSLYEQHEGIPLRFVLAGRKKKARICAIVKDACTYSYKNVFELQKILLDRNIELIERDGYYIAAGIVGDGRTKAVKVDLDIRISESQYIGKRVKERMDNIVNFAIGHSMTEQHARNILAKYDIGVQFLKNETGKIYGVYYIDHKNRIIVKGSQVSKEVSAKAWDKCQERWQDLRYHPVEQETVLYGCMSRELSNMFLYNKWGNYSQAGKDLYYSRKREINRRIL